MERKKNSYQDFLLMDICLKKYVECHRLKVAWSAFFGRLIDSKPGLNIERIKNVKCLSENHWSFEIHFIVKMDVNLWRLHKISHGCFSAFESLKLRTGILYNCIFGVYTLLLYFHCRRRALHKFIPIYSYFAVLNYCIKVSTIIYSHGVCK